MFYEDKEKYANKFMAEMKAKREIESVPICFDQCIKEITGVQGITSNEKNCMRECYFKRVTAADDVYIYFKQRGSVSQLKRAKELLV
jgi:hypothetical protein